MLSVLGKFDVGCVGVEWLWMDLQVECWCSGWFDVGRVGVEWLWTDLHRICAFHKWGSPWANIKIKPAPCKGQPAKSVVSQFFRKSFSVLKGKTFEKKLFLMIFQNHSLYAWVTESLFSGLSVMALLGRNWRSWCHWGWDCRSLHHRGLLSVVCKPLIFSMLLIFIGAICADKKQQMPDLQRIMGNGVTADGIVGHGITGTGLSAMASLGDGIAVMASLASVTRGV